MGRAGWAVLLVLVVSGALVPAAVRSQPVSVTRLGRPDAVLDEEFTRIGAVRELGDGRTIVMDGGEDSRLVVVDWGTGRVQAIGREGRGPGEYSSLAGLHPFGRDSALLADSRGARWLTLDGARIVSTVNYAAERGRSFPLSYGADGRGRVLTTRPLKYGRSPGVPGQIYAESLFVLLERRDAARVDTIARLSGGFLGARRIMAPVVDGGPPIPNFVTNPLAVSEQAMLFPDGWVALLLTNPYRVEWRTPEGRRIAGAPLPFERVPVDDRQKRFALLQNHRAEFRPDQMPPWPAVLPPFRSRALLGTSTGDLVVLRTADARRPATVYDVVDRRGALVRRVTLRADQRIVGFGPRSVYVATTDELDVQRLSRHAWP